VAQQQPRRGESALSQAPGTRDNVRGQAPGEDDDDDDSTGGKRPVKNLNLYMRAVAVLALLVIGAVGVYKGRSMLGAGDKETGPKLAKAKPDAKTSDANKDASSKPSLSSKFVPKENKPSSATSTTKPGTSKPSSLSASFDNRSTTTSTGSSASKSSLTDKKPSSLDKFKFSGSFGKKDDATSPTREQGTSRGGQYSLSDSSNVPDSEYSAGTPEPETDDYSGRYGASPSSIANNSKSRPSPAIVGDEDSEYGTVQETTPPESKYAASDSPDYSQPDAIVGVPPLGGSERPAKAGTPTGSKIPRNAIVSDEPAATEPPSSYGEYSDSNPATDRVASNAAKSPSRLPPNRLPSNSYGTGLSGRSAPTAGRYGQELGIPSTSDADGQSTEPYRGTNVPRSPLGETADDVTPLTSGAASSGAATSGAAVRPDVQGPQTPSIVIEKFAPAEVQVGKAALFEIVVKNVGKVPAYDVTVVDSVPSGTRFQQATPQATPATNGSLVWKLGEMKPGEEQVIELQLVPVAEGEIGSVARVSFQAEAGARSVVTKPRLEVRHEAPQQVHAGEAVTVRLTIVNSGTGAATNVLLQSDVPAGFSHPAGQELEFEVGALRPGESKSIELVMKAEQAGQYENVFVIRGDGDLAVQDRAPIEIVAPSLQVAVTGPKKRFVERQATHAITISNPGTAAAKDVDVVAYLPRGFKFVSADHQGQYDSRQHAVVWGLEELPPAATGSVSVTTLPIEAGEQKLRVEGRSTGGLTANFEQLVLVDAIAELPFTISDLADPIEVGSETTYEIRLSNRGAKDATNVSVAVAFPTDLKPLSGEGSARGTVEGQRVEFAPIARIAPGAEIVLKVHAQGLRAGDHRIAVSLTSDEQQQPVTREESTRVYADQ